MACVEPPNQLSPPFGEVMRTDWACSVVQPSNPTTRIPRPILGIWSIFFIL